MSARSKALYIIHRNVKNKYRHATNKQLWAITYALYNKAAKRRRQNIFIRLYNKATKISRQNIFIGYCPYENCKDYVSEAEAYKRVITYPKGGENNE